MRPIEQLTDEELKFLRDAWEAYPGALGFTPESAPDADAVAAVLIDEGYIERVEITARRDVEDDEIVDLEKPIRAVSYRLRDEWAGQFQQITDRIAGDQ
jgi:hypothetical protein